MTNYVGEQNTPDKVFLDGKVESNETMTAAVAGTAATVTSGATFPVSDLDGLTTIVAITGYAAQTVTYAASTTTAAGVAAQLNAGLDGVSVAVVGSDVVITTDATGNDQAIVVTGTATALAWETPVAGTGYPDGVAITAGMMVARTTSGTAPYTAGDVVPYNSGNDPAGSNEPIGIADFDLTWTASGSKSVQIAKAGRAVKRLVKKLDGTAVTAAEYDKLVKNTGIALEEVLDMAEYQN